VWRSWLARMHGVHEVAGSSPVTPTIEINNLPMDVEFEATFIDVDVDLIRKRLKKLGAKRLKPETLMRRIVFVPPKTIKGGWMRVRDEGDKITLSLKQVTGKRMEDQKEICLVIHDFDSGVRLLEAVGAKRKAYQETKRELWICKNVEITIDTWPGLEPFIEVEGKSEKAVKTVVSDLNLDYKDALFGAVDLVYEKKLGIPPDWINQKTPEITFANPPKRFKAR
jgi:adenylate cyclase, class 2